MKFLFHFLGGIHVAIALITVSILVVITGTVLESKTESHLFAAQWTYHHPFFLFLLALFFINILFSALRRWPFKQHHIPFLMTHLGLLMIIGGTMIKNQFGLQGQLTVWEGSGNQHVVLPHTHALSIEKKGEPFHSHHSIALSSFRPAIYYPFHFPQLKCKIIGYAPHVKEKLETWIKGSQAYIAGFPSISVQNWQPEQTFPQSSLYPFALNPSSLWSILAFRSTYIEDILLKAYLQELNLILKLKGSTDILTIPLKEALLSPFSFVQGMMTVTLNLSHALLKEENCPTLNFTWISEDLKKTEQFSIPLQGQDSLLVKSQSKSWLEAPFTVDLRRPFSLICMVENNHDSTSLFAFDLYGRVHAQDFSSTQLQMLISYDQGFSGYGVQAIFPIPSFSTSREDKEKAKAYAMTMQLQQMLLQQLPLSPPLQLLEKACQQAQINFAQTFVQFLLAWQAHSGLIYKPLMDLPEPLSTVLKYLDWKTLTDADKQAVQWVQHMLHQLEEHDKQGDHPVDILERHQWPFIDALSQVNLSSDSASNLFAQQLASLVNYLPSIDFPSSLTNAEQASLLSAYFRIYDIDYRTLFPYQEKALEDFHDLENYWKVHSPNLDLSSTITFETPLSLRIIPDTLPTKLEDQRPGIVLEWQEGQNTQTIALAYDLSARGLKWPILNGNYLIRFQPELKELPYRIRLRQARQILYPQSQQVYSYESDVLISAKGQLPIEKTLSMNHVYETWDGYRFYLSGIGNSSELKRIQLAVNHDPAKYLLTYPGGVFVFLGILLLFWLYPYTKKPS